MTTRWPVLIAAGGAAALAQTRRKLGLPRGASVALAASLPVAVAASAPPGRGRDAGVWGAHMLAYKLLYEIPYDTPKRTRARLHVDYPIRIDRFLGRGMPPGERLQRALRRPPRISTLDKALSALYASWMLEPHLVLAWILARHPERFGRAAARVGAAYDLSAIGYFAVPTAPPWWASEQKRRMGRKVRRVVIEVKRSLQNERRPVRRKHIQGANPWASMPSDHFATSVMAAIVAAETDRAAGALAAAYALALGFALVYLGEHYLVDVLAGGSLVAGVCAITPVAEPLARRVRTAWSSVEPHT